MALPAPPGRTSRAPAGTDRPRGAAAAGPARWVAAFPPGEDRREASHRPEAAGGTAYRPGRNVRAASAKALIVRDQDADGAAAMSSYGRPLPGAATRLTTTRPSIRPVPGCR
jgi:hypothetical protein